MDPTAIYRINAIQYGALTAAGSYDFQRCQRLLHQITVPTDKTATGERERSYKLEKERERREGAMERREVVRKAEQLVEAAMKGNDASHDAAHVFRVRDMALSLALEEGLSSSSDSMEIVSSFSQSFSPCSPAVWLLRKLSLLTPSLPHTEISFFM